MRLELLRSTPAVMFTAAATLLCTEMTNCSILDLMITYVCFICKSMCAYIFASLCVCSGAHICIRSYVCL